MDMDMDSSMSDSNMSMLFSNGFTQPLYSSAWAPQTRGQYAGTIIFIIVFGIIWRALLAWKGVLEERWTVREKNRRIVVAPSAASRDSVDDPKQDARMEKSVRERAKTGAHPWRWSVDLPRSILTVVTSGVGYLLMLAVMTMNVGYFMSVLTGIFVGELAFGRYIRGLSDH